MCIYNQYVKGISLYLILINLVYVSAFILPLSNTDGTLGFVSVRRRYGERTVTVHLAGISAVETATGELTNGSPMDNDGVKPSFIFREVTDGTEITQVVYDGSYTAKNCFVSSDKNTVQDLLARVEGASVHAPDSVSTLMSHLQYVYNASDHTTVRYNGSQGSLTPLIRSIISLDLIKSQCNKLYRGSHVTVEAQLGRRPRRQRRGLLTYPQTLWCGKGTEAKHYDELGEDATTDTCCRAHDTCPYLQINPMDRKLFLRNIAPYTISHCKCDKMFHNCLKRADTPAAKGVADVYFNKLKLKCFVTRQKKQCLETSFFGSCLKREKTETAVMRDARPFPEGKNFTKAEKAMRRLKRRELLELS